MNIGLLARACQRDGDQEAGDVHLLPVMDAPAA